MSFGYAFEFDANPDPWQLDRFARFGGNLRFNKRSSRFQAPILALKAEVERFAFAEVQGNGRIDERSVGHLCRRVGRGTFDGPGFGFGSAFSGFVSGRPLIGGPQPATLQVSFRFFIASSRGSRFRQDSNMGAEQRRALKFVVYACCSFDRGFKDPVQKFERFSSLKILKRDTFSCLWIGEVREASFPALRLDGCEDIGAIGESTFRRFGRIVRPECGARVDGHEE